MKHPLNILVFSLLALSMISPRLAANASDTYHSNPKHQNNNNWKCDTCHSTHKGFGVEKLLSKKEELICTTCHSQTQTTQWLMGKKVEENKIPKGAFKIFEDKSLPPGLKLKFE